MHRIKNVLPLSFLLLLASCGGNASSSLPSSSVPSYQPEEIGNGIYFDDRTGQYLLNGKALELYQPEELLSHFFEVLENNNCTIEMKDFLTSYYDIESIYNDYQDNYHDDIGFVSAKEGIYEYTLDQEGKFVLGQYYAPGSVKNDMYNPFHLSDLTDETQLSYAKKGYSFTVNNYSVLAHILIDFVDWDGLWFENSSDMTLTLANDLQSAEVEFSYQPSGSSEKTHFEYQIKDINKTHIQETKAFLANPGTQPKRTSFTSSFREAEKDLSGLEEPTIPFPTGASVMFRDEVDTNSSIGKQPLSLGFIDYASGDLTSSYAEQLISSGFTQEEGKDGFYQKTIHLQEGHIPETSLTAMLSYDESINTFRVGFSFTNEDVESSDITYLNETLKDYDDFCLEHNYENKAYPTLPSDSTIIHVLYRGDLTRKHWLFAYLDFKTQDEASAYQTKLNDLFKKTFQGSNGYYASGIKSISISSPQTDEKTNDDNTKTTYYYLMLAFSIDGINQ